MDKPAIVGVDKASPAGDYMNIVVRVGGVAYVYTFPSVLGDIMAVRHAGERIIIKTDSGVPLILGMAAS